MESHDAYTRLLGLALRGGNLVTGSDAVQAAAHAGKIRLLMISADASPHVCRDAQTWAERGNCLLIALPCDKAELGGALGRGNVAVAALTDTGLAAAVGERLAQFDPGRYTDTAERLKRKAERAEERKTAKARARPDTPKRKPDATDAAAKRKPDAPKRTSDAASNATKRKPDAASNRKPGATRNSASSATRKPGATRNSKPGATRNSTSGATRKPNATRNSASGATHGRASKGAGNPRPRRKNTDT